MYINPVRLPVRQYQPTQRVLSEIGPTVTEDVLENLKTAMTAVIEEVR